MPSKWIGGRVQVELVDEPANPKKDVLERVPLEHVVSVIVYGSYARKEMAEESDIDVLLVTDKNVNIPIPSEIRNKYDIQVKSVRDLRNAVAHDPVFYKTLQDDAVAIINHALLDEVRRIKPPMNKIQERLKAVESSIGIIKSILGLDYTHIEDLVYPAIMRLKETMILEYLLDDKKYSTHSLKQEILKSGISTKEFSALMNIYRSVRNGKKKPAYRIQGGTLLALVSLLEDKIQHVRKKTRK